MPLKFSWQKLPVDENGKSYDSLEAFQVAKIREILPMVTNEDTHTEYRQSAELIVKNKALVKEILDLNENCRPSARGVPKKRRTKPSDAQLPLKENAA